MGERAETVANFFSQFNDIMMEMTMMIMSSDVSDFATDEDDGFLD